MDQSTRDANLARSLQTLAEIEATSEAPSRVEAAIMARWDARHTRRDRSRAIRVVRGAAATAAGISLVGALAGQRTVDEPASVPPDSGYTTVAVVGGPVLSDEPVRVVRMRVARSVLGELGLPSAAQSETVDIEVLVGEDGVARGVRVPISEL
jgi:hypothetical protein